MSLKTWKKEFYPTPASKKRSMVAACEHSLQKWIGLQSKNLKKHSVCRGDQSFFTIVDDVSIDPYDDYMLTIDSESCALCKMFLFDDHGNCSKCPLYIVRGNHSCDYETNRERKSPWYKALDDGNPQPMIKWLKKALQYAKDQL